MTKTDGRKAPKSLLTKEDLESTLHLSCADAADILGVTPTTISNGRKRHGLISTYDRKSAPKDHVTVKKTTGQVMGYALNNCEHPGCANKLIAQTGLCKFHRLGTPII